MSKYPRARLGAAAVVAFVCGLYFASGADLTDFGWAQGRVATSTQPSAKAIASLVETQDAFEAIADKAKPAVVSIKVTKFMTRPVQPAQRLVPAPNGGRGGQGRNRSFDSLPPNLRDLLPPGLFGPGMVDPVDPRGAGDAPVMGSGSGFIVTPDGYILTNNHVVRDADVVTVRTIEKRDYIARVIGRDSTTDIAVIKIDATNLPTLAMGDDAKARVGQWVLAIGNPLDLDFTVTAGIVSAKGRQITGGGGLTLESFIQTDAVINPGNSGGPLIDLFGRVIGVNSAIFGSDRFVGYGFAVPIDLARRVVRDLLEYGYLRRPRLGVGVRAVTAVEAEIYRLPEVRGAIVSSVERGRPAAEAGIRIGDVVQSLNGERISDDTEFITRLADLRPGERVTLGIVRDARPQNVQVTLGEFPRENEPRDSAPERAPAVPEQVLGFTVVDLTPQLARNTEYRGEGGVVISDIVQFGGAFRAGLRERTIVLAINGERVRNAAHVRAIAAGIRPRAAVALIVHDPDMGEVLVTYRTTQ
jgi:serine protease Do